MLLVRVQAGPGSRLGPALVFRPTVATCRNYLRAGKAASTPPHPLQSPQDFPTLYGGCEPALVFFWRLGKTRDRPESLRGLPGMRPEVQLRLAEDADCQLDCRRLAAHRTQPAQNRSDSGEAGAQAVSHRVECQGSSAESGTNLPPRLRGEHKLHGSILIPSLVASAAAGG
jgi:hypothetical protein